MSDTQANIEPQEAQNEPEIEVIDTPEPEVVELSDDVNDNPEPKKPFDPKTDKVEFSTPEQQEKFNYMYKQTKASDSRNQMLTELLQEQQKQLDELKNRFSQTDSAEAERVLLNNIKAARDAGDDEAYDKAQLALVRYEASKIVEQKVNDPKPKTTSLQTEPSVKDAEYVSSLMSETDFEGNPVRPWLVEGHPEFNNALNELEKIAANYVGDPAVLQKSLADLDRVMRIKMTTPKNPQPQTRAPNPLQGGGLTIKTPKGTIKMTRAELEIAKKLGVDPKRYAAKRDENRGRS